MEAGESMNGRKTMTVFKIIGGQLDFIGIRHLDTRPFPVVLYIKWYGYDGKTHRRKGGEYASIASALESLATMIRKNKDEWWF